MRRKPPPRRTPASASPGKARPTEAKEDAPTPHRRRPGSSPRRRPGDAPGARHRRRTPGSGRPEEAPAGAPARGLPRTPGSGSPAAAVRRAGAAPAPKTLRACRLGRSRAERLGAVRARWGRRRRGPGGAGAEHLGGAGRRRALPEGLRPDRAGGGAALPRAASPRAPAGAGRPRTVAPALGGEDVPAARALHRRASRRDQPLIERVAASSTSRRRSARATLYHTFIERCLRGSSSVAACRSRANSGGPTPGPRPPRPSRGNPRAVARLAPARRRPSGPTPGQHAPAPPRSPG